MIVDDMLARRLPLINYDHGIQGFYLILPEEDANKAGKHARTCAHHAFSGNFHPYLLSARYNSAAERNVL